MRFDFEGMDAASRFDLMTATMVPRPIAIVTTVDAGGRVNAAPYSFLNVIAVTPPLLAVGVLPNAAGAMKDTGANILATGEFVASMVAEDLAAAMNTTCIDAPPGVNEAELAGLATLPSDTVAPPRIAASPVAFECRLHQAIRLGPAEVVILARILVAHVADAQVLDAAKGMVDTPGLRLIGGMHAAKWYARTGDLFAMERPNWRDWATRATAAAGPTAP